MCRKGLSKQKQVCQITRFMYINPISPPVDQTANIWLFVGRHSVVERSFFCHLTVVCWPFDGHLLAILWLKSCRKFVGHAFAGCRVAVSGLSADCWYTVLAGSSYTHEGHFFNATILSPLKTGI